MCNRYRSLGIRSLILLVFSFWIKNGYSQCLPTNFSIAENIVCQQETLLFNNTSSGTEFLWDFCSNDIEADPTESTGAIVDNLSQAFGYDVVKQDDNYYGFVTNRGSNKLIRLNYGNSLRNTPSITDLGNPGTLLKSPEDIDVVNINGNWYGLVALNLAYPDNAVILFDFGADITNPNPISRSLGNFNISSVIRGISTAYDKGNIVLVLAQSNYKVTLINFRDSFDNTIAPSDKIVTNNLLNATTIFSVETYNKCDEWFVFAASNNRIHKLNFGTDLFNIPISEESYPAADVGTLPFDINAVAEGDSTYLFIGNLDAPYVIYNFNDFSSIPTQVKKGVNPTLTDFNILYAEGEFILTGIRNSSKTVSRVTYKKECEASIEYSYDPEPHGVSYGNSGTYYIRLTTINGTYRNSALNEVTVTQDLAPQAQLSHSNVCQLSEISFSGISQDLIQTYTWSFGDSTTATGDTVQHQYSSAGTYQIRLDVDDGTCTNFVTDSITIYKDAPTPAFDYEAVSNCTNTDILFNNLSDASGIPDSLVSYSWNFNNEFTSTAKTDTTVVFTSAGDKNISLIASIPGCANDTTATITINEGALVDFSFEDHCEEAEVQFTNLTSGTITDLQWTFGNGDSSTVSDPAVIYNSYGDYSVNLEVTNDKGCITYKTDTISIHDLPVADFSHSLSCEGLETHFYDESTVDLANINGWDWSINGEQFSEAMPAYLFENDESYNISLKVTSEYGCADSISRVVDVLPSPVADFSFDKICINEPTNFEDQSTFASGDIKEWQWVIDDKIYSKADITHQFSNSGDYNASLIVTADNLCRNIKTDTIEVHATPEFQFNSSLACEEQPVNISSSINSTDPVVGYNWYVSNDLIGKTEEVTYLPIDLNPLQVRLEINTAGNCVFASSTEIPVYPVPIADFEASTIYGGAPLEVTYEDYSSGGNSIDWFINDIPMLVETGKANTILEIGDYLVTQVVATDIGCTDSAFVNIEVVEPTLDLELQKVRVISDAGNQSFLLDIMNKGSAQVKDMEVDISINNEVSFKENVTNFLNSGEKFSTMLLSTLESRPRFMCFTVNAKGTVLSEEDVENNSMCVNFDGISFLLKPYPNPANDQVTIPILLRENNSIKINVINSIGALVYETSVQGIKDEMINYNLSVRDLPQGFYVIKVISGIQEQTFPIIINH
ncbi:MAG: PKD domain-containing protein [Candidatus Cyclobacteriaceae bacterium M2_1C_046]